MVPLGYQVPLCFFFFYWSRYTSGPATISWVINIKILSSSFPKATETTAVKSCNPARETVSLEAISWACSLSKILGFVQVMITAHILLMHVYKMIKTCHKMPLFWHILPLLFLFSSSPALTLVGSCARRDCRAPCGAAATSTIHNLFGGSQEHVFLSLRPVSLVSPIAMPLALLFPINTWCSR